MRTIIILIGLVLVIGFFYQNGSTTRPARVQQTVASSLDKSAEMQAGRKQLLEKMIGEGVFQKIERPGTLARAYVGPAFYGLTIDDKTSFVSVVYAYFYDGTHPTEHVRIFDSRTGNEVGMYPDASGKVDMF